MMIKKRLLDGSECRKCAEAVEHLRSRELLGRIDEVVWAQEGDATSPGMILGQKFGIPTAPFFVVTEDGAEQVYASVLQLVRERFGQAVSTTQQAAAIDVDDVGI
jgi:hypothetical protein